ncbi:MAG: isoleucine--tRNA ligase, partial [Candidatus Cloacimonetes bacterium]|nr:isoleucine--tRNA ligase [Candidatus Cloacimonadota bacterium]
VNPKETYVKVMHNGEKLILAKARLSVLDGEYEVIDEFVGQTLEYRDYEPLFTFVETDKKAWYIGVADYVTMDDGTGIVHTAPAFGQDDYTLGMKYGLPFIQPVDGAGKFTEVVTDWAGEFVKDADKGIIKNLKDREVLYKRLQINHSYPHCWRCSSPLVYYARESWYIRTQQYRELLIENNNKINWVPSFVGEKRFGAWLENNIDWALSRDRFWGTPLNIWVCDDCGKLDSAGSIAELRAKGKMLDGSEVPEGIELHRPYVDEVEFVCQHCGGKMHRTKEVIDCWFDSGAMPFAQWHYPFENADIFDSELFPADFISEGIDQTRGWFYTLLTISTILKGVTPFKNVLVNDLILDKNGIKMSKSKGNSVDPMELMEQYGADAIRWYLVSNSVPWVPTKFDIKGVEEVIGKFIGTLKNVYSFFVTYTNIDGFNAQDYTFNENQSLEIDKWIISRLNTVIKQVTEANDGYDFTRALRIIQDFVLDEVSNWYVRRSRRRFWVMELTEDKKTAYLTLHHILVIVSKLMAPFAPYLAEDIYTNLTGKESVHLAEYPVAKDELIYPVLEAEMTTIIDLVSLGRAARNTSQIKVRQTLQRLFVPERTRPVVERMLELIKEEINVKEIEYISEHDDFVHFEMKPNFKVMGPKFGKNMKPLAAHLATLNGGEILACFKADKPFVFTLNGETFEIVEEDVSVSIQQKEGFVFESSKYNYVALDTTLNEDLIMEGYARELINKIQFTRKENNYEIMDRIDIRLSGDDEIKNAVALHKDYICAETLAESIEFGESPDMTEWDINGKQVHIALTKR